MEKGEKEQVGVGVGTYVEMACIWELTMAIFERTQMLCKLVIQSAFGFTNGEETTLGTPNAVDKIVGGAHESLPQMDGFFTSLGWWWRRYEDRCYKSCG